jgi:hypothetical protein
MILRGFLIASLLFLACQMKSFGDDRALAIYDQGDSGKHEKVLLAFVASAQAGDASAMLALSSKNMIARTGGAAKQREIYINKTIPVLKAFPNIAKSGTERFGSDDAGHYGWIFTRVFLGANGQELPLEFTIFREDGVLVVSRFAKAGKR